MATDQMIGRPAPAGLTTNPFVRLAAGLVPNSGGKRQLDGAMGGGEGAYSFDFGIISCFTVRYDHWISNDA
jgi:hypothetical protein